MEPTAPSSATESIVVSRCVQICQSKSCRKLGAAGVLAAFQLQPVVNVEVTGCGCFGQCGNGPIVVVSPDQVWYCGVQADEVGSIVDRHLKSGQPVKAMLYPKFHPALHR
ncbi:MAG: (2Fe-2S) ferredoxin domain-containing protein [Candidatus Parcubacteria bacterium]|nr:(2Fe-2S) ferredoxin domain-containing protein [Leptolyngbyaceae cyanobacterium LF-bin-113]